MNSETLGRITGEPKPMFELFGFGLVGVVRLKAGIAAGDLKTAKRNGSYWKSVCDVMVRGQRRQVPLRKLISRSGVFLWDWTPAPLESAKADLQAALDALASTWRAASVSRG